MSVTGYIGIVAAFCTTVAFVPQIVKLRKQGGKDLSYSMLFLYLTGVRALAGLRDSDPRRGGDLGERAGHGAGADFDCAEGQSAEKAGHGNRRIAHRG